MFNKGGMGGMGNIMKQAQKMQEEMQKAQEEVAKAEVTGESGAGLVSIVMNGRHDVKRVAIDDSLMDDDKEGLAEVQRRAEELDRDPSMGMTMEEFQQAFGR